VPLYLQFLAVKLEKNGARKWSKGYAFIQYTCQEDAMLALENMDYKVLLRHLSCYSPQRFTYNNIYLLLLLLLFFPQNFDGRVIYVELAKPGGNAFGGRPRTSGPPKVQHLQEQDEVPDCWY
jgi:cold-inducible RNA-binding protein